MKLSEICTKYCLAHELSADYEYQLEYAVRRFELHLGRPAVAGDLTPDAVNAWLRHERQSGQIADRSRRNVRQSILTLWKWHDPTAPTSAVRLVRVAKRPPEAWDFEEMQAVAEAAGRLHGHLKNGVRRALYFSTVLWFTFETGLRRTDVWRFDVTRLDDQRRASMTQNKSGQVHVIEVTPETHAGLMALHRHLSAIGARHARTPLHWPFNESAFYYWIRRARALAGIDATIGNRAMQHIRRTGATAVECAEPDGATKYLGHRSGPTLAWASYIDPRKATRSIMPPTTRHHHGQRTSRIGGTE
ncbi:hypothetical protein V7x_28890 [Crateriforma conspicua]|uniref:Site-specific tyrosine recombinase XerC n=1 Tax=Crateriforma conspicua TaxID=2527996 RepID=A0A5C6G0A4_9PLAN|nr:hypothetical protein [Crateriforma conspicua]TWU67315.1 hypothetical protein V7x_28890 [Crateriforma conspicua]